jgi:hypothetical protein
VLKTLFSQRARKAWLAGAAALITSLITGSRDGALDLTDYLTAAGATVGAISVVYGVRNGKKGDEV